MYRDNVFSRHSEIASKLLQGSQGLLGYDRILKMRHHRSLGLPSHQSYSLLGVRLHFKLPYY